MHTVAVSLFYFFSDFILSHPPGGKVENSARRISEVRNRKEVYPVVTPEVVSADFAQRAHTCNVLLHAVSWIVG